MNKKPETSYSKALGARILSEANDLKRTPEALAAELNMPLNVVQNVIAGTVEIGTARTVIEAIVKTYPISFADLWIEPDDTDEGIVIMRAEESQATSRVFDRKDRSGKLYPYYEYRDTAMSRTGPFKPEWIKELRVVDDADPDNQDIAFNNGHLLHQQTFVVGEVNFYWSLGGEKFCAEMNTGDSNYITPYVPHSFASRNADALGLVVAVTFGGHVRRALADFARVDEASVNDLSGDLRSFESGYRARLARHLASESMTVRELTRRLVRLSVTEGRATALAGGARPDMGEVQLVAAAMNVRPADLMVSTLEADEEVIVHSASDGGTRLLPEVNAANYRIRELARTKHQPSLKGFAVDVLSDGKNEAEFRHSLFEYIYNYGDESILLRWADEREALLNPGDSACIQPMIPHSFVRPKGANEGQLCVVRVPGALDERVIDEFASFASEGRQRVIRETRQWF